MKKIAVLPFGGCTTNTPISHAIQNQWGLVTAHEPSIPDIYTIKEVVQILDVWAGRIILPSDLLPFISPWPTRLVQRSQALQNYDAIILEPSSEVELLIDGFSANRAAISVNVLRPVKEISKDAHRQLSKWYHKGITKFDDNVRQEGARDLICHIPDDFPNAAMIKKIIDGLRSEPADIGLGFRNVLSRVSIPVGVVPFVFQYFADGRFMHWPEHYHASILKAVTELNLPLFSPEQIVLQYGVEQAMRPDFRHYHDDFIETISNELVAFIRTFAKS